jgi:acyl-CoA synthetase (AMP-forming)/AMP-acid ligase II
LRRPYRWLEAISKYKATTSPFPNFALDLCIKRITEEEKSQLDLSCWTVACNGAEPVREDSLRRFSEAFARCGFNPKAHFPVYGLAESTLLASGGRTGEGARVRWLSRTALQEDRVAECPPGDAEILPVISCGRATVGHRVEIVDPRSRRRCEAERVGEIWLAGPSVAHGYWRNRVATEEHFGARLEEEPEQTFLRTGDLGFIRDGELYVTGRLKDVIIIGGANLYPHDIEMAAEKSPDADIRAGCSAAFSLSVEQQERLVIVAESKKLETLKLDDSIKAVRKGIIDGIGVVPYRVVLIKAGTISKTSSGKIQRRLTRAQYLDGQLSCLAEG